MNVLNSFILTLCTTCMVIGEPIHYPAANNLVHDSFGENNINSANDRTFWEAKYSIGAESTTPDFNYTWIPENSTQDNFTWAPVPSSCGIFEFDGNWTLLNGSIYLGNISDYASSQPLANFSTVDVESFYLQESKYLDFHFDAQGGGLTIRLTDDFNNWKLKENGSFQEPHLELVTKCYSGEAYTIVFFATVTFSNMYAPIFEDLNPAGYHVALISSPSPGAVATSLTVRDPDYNEYDYSWKPLNISLYGYDSWAYITSVNCSYGTCFVDIRSRFSIILPEPAQLIVSATDNDYRPMPKSTEVTVWLAAA